MASEIVDGEFWRSRWRQGRLGWHQETPNPLLLRHLPALGLSPGSRLFLPLCGKTRDIGWLLGQGFRVAGAELVEAAVEQLFAELGVEPAIEPAGGLKRYSAERIDVFVGDVFDLSAEALGPVDAVWDRAALIAMPPELRPAYAAYVAALAGRAPQLLVTLAYDQSVVAGPPFSVSDEEVRALYSGRYGLALLEGAEVDLKGICPAQETVWRLG
jgi:thiopurine S-methyltransferase